MVKRSRPNHRLVKIHFTYSVEDVAALFRIHKNTVREWIRRGLPALDKKRPLLILGSVLAQFLKDRREAAKRPCGPGELYCVKCRQPRAPAGAMVEFKAVREPLGNLSAICPVCDSLMCRRASRDKLPALLAEMERRATLAHLHISQSNPASLNRDFVASLTDHANSQPTE